ncbi:histone-fold-containing protein [Fusarium acuminatum]|uniref:Histone-fold-containing protein n=1 Tax=Fusarium acuminatum TaxID=5515 RepID=A0ABZ2WMA4_9HYPO
MPYNTTAIPPRKEPTGQNQLPLSRVKKIIAQDPEIGLCSNNAAFVITLAAEMFVQHLAEESHTSSAISHHDNLEFLEDVVPKTIPYKNIKASAKATQARLRGDNNNQNIESAMANGANKSLVNGNSMGASAHLNDVQDDPNSQLEMESRQAVGANRDGDVAMTG